MKSAHYVFWLQPDKLKRPGQVLLWLSIRQASQWQLQSRRPPLLPSPPEPGDCDNLVECQRSLAERRGPPTRMTNAGFWPCLNTHDKATRTQQMGGARPALHGACARRLGARADGMSDVGQSGRIFAAARARHFSICPVIIGTFDYRKLHLFRWQPTEKNHTHKGEKGKEKE